MRRYLWLLMLFLVGCAPSIQTIQDRILQTPDWQHTQLAHFWLATDGGRKIIKAIIVPETGKEHYVKCGLRPAIVSLSDFVNDYEDRLVDYAVCDFCHYDRLYGRQCDDFVRKADLIRDGDVAFIHEGDSQYPEAVCVFFHPTNIPCL